ncbi:MAG: glutamate racemase [Rickettsiales bacterium]|jgi:glutamate racemase|nr:glutamate racemase [Rickettsiales bacterium]
MNIGVFDSGLGGLIVTKALADAMPEYSFSYLGDTKHVPYGSRSGDAVYGFAHGCVDYLFRKRDCRIVVVACNTASIAALRRLQREYLPDSFPDRRILGVVVPTMEYVAGRGIKSAGLLATDSTVRSKAYECELAKIDSGIRLVSVAAPLLVPLIENGGERFARPVVREYIERFRGTDVDSIILGCTHYPFLEEMIKEEAAGALGRPIEIISQTRIVPDSLRSYLARHPEIESDLAHGGGNSFAVTDITDSYRAQAARLFGRKIDIEKVEI